MRIHLLLLGTTVGTTLLAGGIAQAAVTPIPQIQGSTDTSPLEKQTVETTGVVTASFQGADALNGFYIQDPKGDGNDATSDGVFVFQAPRGQFSDLKVKAGDLVHLTGRVAEFRGQTELTNLTALEVTGQGELPKATEIHLPLPDAQREKYEGMLVTFPDELTVSDQHDLKRYGTIALSSGGRLFNPTNTDSPNQPNLQDRVLLLDDASNGQNPKTIPYVDENGTRRAGDTVAGLTGILTFDYEKYRLQPTVAPVFTVKNPRPKTTPEVGGNLRIAGVNLHNYWVTFKNDQNPDARGAEGATAFARQSAKIIAELKGLNADVYGFMELENNPNTLPDLIGKLNAAVGAGTYAAVADPTTGVGTDAIKVGIIYRVSRVQPVGASSSSPDPIFQRFPLAQTFRDKTSGGVFTLMVNHWKSKGSCPETGDVDTGEGCWNEMRTKQAQAAADFAAKLQKSSGDNDVLVMGDLNAYVNEKPLRTIREAGWKHLNLRLPAEERYSFGYDGQYGSLDHALASASLDTQITGVGEWHINSDEPYFLDFAVAGAKADDSPYRASDHDPFLIGLALTKDPE